MLAPVQCECTQAGWPPMLGRPGRAKQEGRWGVSRASIAKLRAGQLQKEMLEADGCNFQMHSLPGSAYDLLQWFEKMSSVFDKQPHYPVGAVDAAYQTGNFDGS